MQNNRKDITNTDITSDKLIKIKENRSLTLRKEKFLEKEIDSMRFKPRVSLFKSSLEIDLTKLQIEPCDLQNLKYFKPKKLKTYLNSDRNSTQFKYGLYLCREYFKQTELDTDDLKDSEVHLILLQILQTSTDLVTIFECLWALSGYAKNTDTKYELVRPLYFEDSTINMYLSYINHDNIDIKIMALDLIGNVTGCFNYARDRVLNSQIFKIIRDLYISSRGKITSDNFNMMLKSDDSLVMEIYRKCVMFYYNCVKVKCELSHQFMFEIIEILCDAIKINYKDKDTIEVAIQGIFTITYYDPLIFLHKIAEQKIVSLCNKLNYQEIDPLVQYNLIVIIGNILVGEIETFDLMFEDGVYEWLLMVINHGKKTRQVKHAIWCFSNIVAKYKKYKMKFVTSGGLEIVYNIMNDKDCDFDSQSRCVKLIERLTMNLDLEINNLLIQNGIFDLIKHATNKYSDLQDIEMALTSLKNIFQINNYESLSNEEKHQFLANINKCNGIDFIDVFIDNSNKNENISNLAQQIKDYYDKITNEIDIQL